MITVDNLHKSFKNVKALKGVSCSGEKGVIFALLGANGAGKTPAINILTRLLNTDSGTATVDNILTARENLELIAELRPVSNSKKIASELVKRPSKPSRLQEKEVRFYACSHIVPTTPFSLSLSVVVIACVVGLHHSIAPQVSLWPFSWHKSGRSFLDRLTR